MRMVAHAMELWTAVSDEGEVLAHVQTISQLRFFELKGGHCRQVVNMTLGVLECKEWG
ncbi:hypothetical protein Bca101_028016 [Brassica carinata]